MLILGSASQARKRLLINAGIKHKTIPSNIDESTFSDQEARILCLNLAKAKANFVYKKVNNEYLDNFTRESNIAVLACDSLFEFEGDIYGKPKDEMEAIQRWKVLSGKTGLLHTGHCLIINNDFEEKPNQISKTITTKIDFEKITHKEIDEYVKTGEPLSCAGGFAIERKGSIFIKKIDGCFSNVIGLSLPWLRRNYLNTTKNNK